MWDQSTEKQYNNLFCKQHPDVIKIYKMYQTEITASLFVKKIKLDSVKQKKKVYPSTET
jgi:hypothetical protein